VKKAMETPELIEFAKKNGYELYYGSVSDVETELKRDREVTASLIEAMQKDKATK
jgi:tripartite-type tricarboxylate transporter receptor subunit TctC